MTLLEELKSERDWWIVPFEVGGRAMVRHVRKGASISGSSGRCAVARYAQEKALARMAAGSDRAVTDLLTDMVKALEHARETTLRLETLISELANTADQPSGVMALVDIDDVLKRAQREMSRPTGPLQEGYVRKGGRNPPPQSFERPPPPPAFRPSREVS
jgi:hypothetical protein